MNRAPARWLWHGLFSLAAGLIWLACGFGFGPVGLAIALVPGAFLTATGVSMLFWTGDLRIAQFMALSAIMGAILSIPGMALYTVGLGFLLLFASLASFLASGFAVMRQASLPEGVPAPEQGPANAAKVALDESLLAYFSSTADVPTGERAHAMAEETSQWLDMIRDNGWDADPAAFHRTPPALEDPRLEHHRSAWPGNIEYELMSFDSGYEPYPEQPGGPRWQSYANNRTAYARILRHPDGPRPWLIGIHGYRMGEPWLDFALFEPKWLHHELGLNLMLPLLPLHGHRKKGWRTGDGYLEGNIPDMVNAAAQAIWDIRRMLQWVRHEAGSEGVGVLGYSLGGYNAALLSCLEPDLACVIAGIPAVDMPQLLWRHMPPEQARYLREQGIGLEQAQAAMRVVSPLAMPCQVPKQNRFMFGGIVDRLVLPPQVLSLHAHWEHPRLEWYQGAHLTFRGQSGVRQVIQEGLETGGLVG